MAQHAIVSSEEELNSVLQQLGIGELDEVVESIEQIEAEPTELELESVTNHLDTQEVMEQHYADEPVSPISMPEGASEPAVKSEGKKGKGKKKEPKAAKTPKEPKAAKEPKAPRKLYTSKAERVSDKLTIGDFVLTLSDATLTGDDLVAKQKETLAMFENGTEGIGIKVQNRMTWLMEFVAGKSAKLNEVIERALRILKKEGFIKSGDKGNLHADLMTKYSPASARAMGNNTIAALRALKVIEKGTGGSYPDGAYVANPESLVLVRVNGMLGM